MPTELAAMVMALAASSAGAEDAPAASVPTPSGLNLTCDGRATFTVANLDLDENGHFKDDKRIDTAGRVALKVQDGAVRLRLPPGVPGGGNWTAADQVAITPEKIEGRLKGSLLFRVMFSVDRRTGDIQMTGSVRYSGNREKAPDDGAATKF